MDDGAVIGWDLGGAHAKAALVDGAGRLRHVVQMACPLWQGLDRLDAAMEAVLMQVGHGVRRHAVTMTGELADLFPDRSAGVRALAEASARRLRGSEVRIYAGPMGFRQVEEVMVYSRQIASANWLASATVVARHCGEGVLVDVGSTTTDIIPFQDCEPCHKGYTDFERLHCDELVYTGVVRTPVHAVAERVPYEGEWRPLLAERFAVMADVYRLTGDLPEGVDMAQTCDGADKGMEASARRLARMLGRDFAPRDLELWRELARFMGHEQLIRLQRAVARVLSCGLVAADMPIVGAGAGRFLVRQLARCLHRPYVDFADLVTGADELREWAAVCAPAVAVAQLFHETQA